MAVGCRGEVVFDGTPEHPVRLGILNYARLPYQGPYAMTIYTAQIPTRAGFKDATSPSTVGIFSMVFAYVSPPTRTLGSHNKS